MADDELAKPSRFGGCCGCAAAPAPEDVAGGNCSPRGAALYFEIDSTIKSKGAAAAQGAITSTTSPSQRASEMYSRSLFIAMEDAYLRDHVVMSDEYYYERGSRASKMAHAEGEAGTSPKVEEGTTSKEQEARVEAMTRIQNDVRKNHAARDNGKQQQKTASAIDKLEKEVSERKKKLAAEGEAAGPPPSADVADADPAAAATQDAVAEAAEEAAAEAEEKEEAAEQPSKKKNQNKNKKKM
eukprot:g7331.t1